MMTITLRNEILPLIKSFYVLPYTYFLRGPGVLYSYALKLKYVIWTVMYILGLYIKRCATHLQSSVKHYSPNMKVQK